MRILATFIGFALVAAGVRRVEAGADCGPEEARIEMTFIEKFAKDKKTPEPTPLGGWFCIDFEVTKSPALAKRVHAACEKILARDGAASQCWQLVAMTGATTLGKHDVFAHTAALKEDPLNSVGGDWPQLRMLTAMHDPRGAQVIVDRWRATLPRAEAREKKKRSMTEWSSWRQRAAAALAELGSAGDVAFLEEQAKATKDKHVATACRDAIKAIEKRAAATKAP